MSVYIHIYIIYICFHNFTGTIAFSALLKPDLWSSTDNETVVFSRIVTNIGSAYNGTTGQFTAPSDGVFVFSWTLLTDPEKQFNSHLVVDGEVKLHQAVISGYTGKSYESSGCSGVLQLKAGQKVWIRKQLSYGDYLRAIWSSFSGWQIR